MGKNSGSSQINQSDQWYQQEVTNANALTQQFNDLYLPILKQLLPELQTTVEGGASPLMDAAEAPVKAQGASLLRTIGNNAGSATNPDALFSDLLQSTNTSSALAGDSMLSQALAALENLTGFGYGSLSTAMSGVNNAAGGEGQIGTNLNAANDAMWGSLFQGLGTAAGAMGSGGASAAAKAPSGDFRSIMSAVAQPPVQTVSGQPFGLTQSTMPWLYNQPSEPISSQRPGVT